MAGLQRQERSPSLLRAAGILSILLLAGCATLDDTYVQETFVRQKWLPFIEDGRIGREEIMTRLGEPTGIYRGGNILAYRLILSKDDRRITLADYQRILFDPGSNWYRNRKRKELSEQGALVVIREREWEERFFQILVAEAEYHLILILDDRDLLKTHSFLRIRP